MERTAVLINEFGDIGLDHLLVQQVDESVLVLRRVHLLQFAMT